MNLIPIAFDSLGVRSMATCLEAGGLRVMIDPAVSLGPRRYGLPPHPVEIDRLNAAWQEVRGVAESSDIIIVTHYHYDHHNPDDPDIYKGKIVYIKDPKNRINFSQKRRAHYFLGRLEGEDIRIADGGEFSHGPLTIRFSQPVYHGTGNRLGYVIETSISCGEDKVLYTSDVEGPAMDDQVSFILEENPRTLILDGPMTYLLGYRYSEEDLSRSVENIIKIISSTSIKTIVIDHHFMRDIAYADRIPEVYMSAQDAGVRVLSAAELTGRTPDLLEARRKELYRSSPVNRESSM
ncbi:MAG TPA: hypothetical protein PK659_06280 [Methanothrix sp.]|nr:hypothetical protein [Methanothrix sp.]HOK58672.1 hypothetical protein [Methanothrix sp.]HOL43841.1 hypothetical protein [Methanothrix sp.]HPO88926.1 hypothetical protein [Methanothrix sp.]